MASTTTDRNIERGEAISLAYKVKAGEKIPAGVIVSIDADGYAVNGSDTAGQTFLGVSRKEADNTNGADGAIVVEVWTTGLIDFNYGGTATQADVHKPAVIEDNQTVNTTTTNSLIIGKIVEVVSATKVRVKLLENLTA